MTNITDSGIGFEAKASQIDKDAMDCLSRFVTKKASIENVRH